MQITCVVGLPGSGKTCLMWNKCKDSDFICDDPYDLTALAMIQELQAMIGNLWIADPYFCITQVREQAEIKLFERFGVRPDWIFFENDPVACWSNVQRRMDGRQVRGLIHALQSRYEIPTGAHVIPVWRPESE